jgi:hypothetical protein
LSQNSLQQTLNIPTAVPPPTNHRRRQNSNHQPRAENCARWANAAQRTAALDEERHKTFCDFSEQTIKFASIAVDNFFF